MCVWMLTGWNKLQTASHRPIESCNLALTHHNEPWSDAKSQSDLLYGSKSPITELAWIRHFKACRWASRPTGCLIFSFYAISLCCIARGAHAPSLTLTGVDSIGQPAYSRRRTSVLPRFFNLFRQLPFELGEVSAIYKYISEIWGIPLPKNLGPKSPFFNDFAT